MKNGWFLLAVGFLVLCSIPSASTRLGLFALYGFYLYFRIHKPGFLFLWCLLAVCAFVIQPQLPDHADTGWYQVEQIRPNYSIASQGKVKVLVYEGPDCTLGDEIYLETFEPISDLNNLNIFSFAGYLKKQGIVWQTYDASKAPLRPGNTLKGKIYRYMAQNEMYLQLFYNISPQETFFSAMSLGIVVFLSWIRLKLQSFLSERSALLFCLGLGLLYGLLFLVNAALVRLLLSFGAKLLFKNRLNQVSFIIVSFCFLYPGNPLQFVFMMWLLQSLMTFAVDPIPRLWSRPLVTALVMLAYFGQVNLLSLLTYSFARTLYACYFLYGLLSLLFGLPAFVPDSLPWEVIYTWSITPWILAVIIILLLRAWFFWNPRQLLSLGLAWILVFSGSWLDPFFHVYFLNIGQGDCALIVEPFHRSAVMIDVGGSYSRDNVERIVQPFLESLHLSHLDTLIISHDDFDHNGGMDSLAAKIPVHQIITQASEEVNVPYPMAFLLPERQETEGNDASLVCYFVYDQLGYLFMGDASCQIEKQIMQNYAPLKADVLKVGHHGSQTSTSQEFAGWVQAKIGIISVGAHNRYGHPHAEVLHNLEEAGTNIFMTKDYGMIHIFSFRSFAGLETGTGQIAFFKES